MDAAVAGEKGGENGVSRRFQVLSKGNSRYLILMVAVIQGVGQVKQHLPVF